MHMIRNESMITSNISTITPRIATTRLSKTPPPPPSVEEEGVTEGNTELEENIARRVEREEGLVVNVELEEGRLMSMEDKMVLKREDTNIIIIILKLKQAINYTCIQ